jgi:molybdate transport system substrate-binding protein
MKRFLGIVLVLGAIVTSIAAPPASIVVFAAASLTDCLNEIASKYARQTGDHVVFNFGASSSLARQIQEGAPADVFLSADEAKMDGLEKKGLIEAGTRKSRLSNLLVIIVGADSPLRIRSPDDLTNSAIRRVALADPQAVPAGVYAKEYFQKLGLWPRIQPKVVPTENVRAALAAVESGNVEAGVVYKTDAAISSKVKVAFVVARNEGPAISYPMAVIKESTHLEPAKQFLKFLDSEAAAKVFEEFGFIVQR